MTNKISEAVEQWAEFAEQTRGTSDVIHAPKDAFIAIAEKYLRMEEALEKYVKPIFMRGGNSHEIQEAMWEVKEALAFDPLNSSSPNS